MTTPAPPAPVRELEARIPDLLRRDEAALRTLLDRATRRLAREQPADRLLAQAARYLDEALLRAEAFRATLPEPRYADDLPIHAARERIVATIRNHAVTVLCGETGSGKTTQLPKLCLDAGRGRRGRIGHTQPRRIAARSVAARIAEELGSEVGAAVGYKVRFNDQTGPDTHIKLMTDGILLAELRQDPDLLGYDTLVIDEAHERSLNIDFLLGYLKRLLPRRPDLRLIITSATLDPERLAAFFGDAPILEVPGRAWPVEVRYRPLQAPDDDPSGEPATGSLPERDLFDGIADAVAECCREGPGDILVFLPGEREIRDAALRLRREQPAHTEILPLYARLSAAEQSRVFRPHPGRRIVLATNVAETALTVPGIRFVIDTGLARISRYSWRSRVQRLSLEPVAQDSCNQRAGRCGRLGPGICYRLFSDEDYALRPEHSDPEILRSNLAAVILQMAALGLGDPRHFPFVDPPDPRLIRDGYRLLEELHAVDGKGRITAHGRRLAHFPVDPRFAAMLLAGGERGVLTETLTIASFLALQDPRERPAEHAQAADEAQRAFRVEGSDFLTIVQLWNAWHRTREELGSSALKRWCREHFLSYLRMREWQELRAQLATLARQLDLHRNEQAADPEPLHKALLAGLLGHVGRKTERGDYLGTRNRHFQIHPGSGLAKKRPDWIMAAEIAETTRVYAREAASIRPDWILEVGPHLLKHHVHEPHFQARDGRIGAWDRITLYGLVVAPRAPVNLARHDPQEARRLFIQHGLVEGQLRSRSRGLATNRAAVAEIAELEARGRRRDLLAEEDRLRAFYDARLPPEIVDGPGFEAWCRRAERTDPDVLRIEPAELMNEPGAALPQGAYPDALEIQGIRLPLSYRFEPGQPDDGVTATVPIAALNGLPDWLGDWLVPGLLEERVTGLLRSLPKGLRRNFVPAPEFARAALERMPAAEGPLLPALTEALEAITGTRVPAEAWRPEQVEPHLQMRFRILEPDGAEAASGRDLPALKRGLGDSAGAHFDATRPDDIARDGITNWDFGPLPEFVEFEHQGAQLRAYPALIDAGDSVSLRLESDPDNARRLHRGGLRRLFLLGSHRIVRDLRRQLPDIQRACLHYAALGSCEALREQILAAAADRVFLAEPPWPRDAEAFRERLEAGQPRLSATTMELAQLSARILADWHDLRRRLDGDLPLSWIEAARDIRDQLAHLVPADFLLATPPETLPELPRYLQAIARRLERLEHTPDKDRRLRVDIEPMWDEAKRLLAAHPEDPTVLRFRYRVEELRVSVFAQELGTREKVSIPRLARELDELRRSSATPFPVAQQLRGR
ncbi:ATP-dependent RNA helicase HrpA [Thioalkalivibrio paradoxus]|uniref:RNA helicase n=1 Tax=Thioalkalivibrio paradoxus ARh 1 TaxID=713585 RepID=W0DJ33_9GAMM|nr:ATP-dependent RNA helicase HrpA [Thioalkalivibrio paradoxus]AHE97232.1 RNA helicase [Thioalkalivibrio paradoxus ARh 1]